jgi:heme-degrading monooxygenase HmoA
MTLVKEGGSNMFARFTRFQIKIDTADQAKKIFEESVIPAAKAQKGYRGAYWLIDRKTGEGMAITLWNSEEDAVANEKSRYYQEQLEKFLDFLTAPFIREGYEIVIQV